MVEVLVEYDYTAKEPDELSIKKGDIIKDVIKKQGGWWEGVLNDKKGMFPDNFVRVIERDSSVTYRSRKDSNRIRQCRVVFSYKQDHQDELNLNVGEVIEILGEEEEGWWRGSLNGKQGVFPSNFVEEIKSKSDSREDLTSINDNEVKSPTLPPKPAKLQCQVKYSYKAQNEDELSLKEGDIITVISKDGQDPGWWKGELNGKVGVFPDNFVSVANESDDKKNKSAELISSKPISTSQRKSTDGKHEKLETDGAATRVTPPIPSKKPSIPIKKSPSGANGQDKLLAGLRRKLVDVIDGATGSKSQPVLIKASEIKEDNKQDVLPENAFDQVERTAILPDVRATRAKAPGRRPPSVVFKEGEPGIVNGNTDHAPLDSLSEHMNSRPNSEQTEHEVKPRVREWEKHKAPWLEEMKLNQAKRTSTSPGPEQNKLKLTPSEKCTSPDIEESKSNKTSPFEKTSSNPIDMSKSMSAANKIKTPPNELEKNSVLLRNKPAQSASQPSIRPQTIHSTAVTNVNESQSQKHFSISNPPTTAPKISPTPPIQNSRISPNPKPQVLEKNVEMKAGGDITQDSISPKQYLELLQRIEKLEQVLEQQNQFYKTAIDELKGKLQVETDMRILLQAELEKVSQYAMQV